MPRCCSGALAQLVEQRIVDPMALGHAGLGDRTPYVPPFEFLRKELIMRTLKEMVSDNQSVFFVRYREGELFYITECGLEFPVPISEAGGAEFLAQDKALLFMRYIRKEIERIEHARALQSAALA